MKEVLVERWRWELQSEEVFGVWMIPNASYSLHRNFPNAGDGGISNETVKVQKQRQQPDLDQATKSLGEIGESDSVVAWQRPLHAHEAAA